MAFKGLFCRSTYYLKEYFEEKNRVKEGVEFYELMIVKWGEQYSHKLLFLKKNSAKGNAYHKH